MKILFILTYYRPHWTGLTQYAARLAEGLAKKHHRVEIFCSQHAKNLPKEEVVNQVKVFRLPVLCKFLRSVIMPEFPFQLWDKIKENEKVIVYLPLQEVSLVALFCKLQRKKLFLVHNGDLVLPSSCGFFCRLIEKIYYLTTTFATKVSEKIIIQTEDYAVNSSLLKKFKNKWAIILPMYDIPKINQKDTEKFKKKHFLENKILIGFSGRLVEEKGIDFLLQAIPEVVKKTPDAHFVFAGDNKIFYEKFWDKIRILIEENKKNITLLGLIKDQKELFAFYKSLSVYVQPSRTDCFPSSQVEALLSGVPSVCTDIPGARWIVKRTNMGEIVKPRNPQSLAEGVVKVIQNKEKYLKHRPEVKKIFDYQKTLNQYEELFTGN